MFRHKKFGPCYFADGDGGAGGVGGGAADGGNGGAGDGGAGGNEFNFEEFKATYGKDYADKGFMRELDSPGKIFEKIDNLETLIGKKSFVPGENATDNEWADYRNRIELKSPDDYTITDDSLPDNLKTFHNEDINGKIKQMFYNAGLTPGQAKILNDSYNKIMVDANNELLNSLAIQESQQKLLDEDFDRIANESWGNDRENVQNVANSLLKEFTPDNLKSSLNDLDNKSLIIMASVLKGISDKYISEDDLATLRKGNGSDSNLSVREEAQKELAKLAQMSMFDPNYAAQKAKVDNLYSAFKK